MYRSFVSLGRFIHKYFIPGCPALHKRGLAQGLPPASPGSVALLHWTPWGTHLCQSGFRDLNATPFQLAEGNGGHCPSFGMVLAHLSGPTDSSSTPVFLPWEIPWMEDSCGLPYMGPKSQVELSD